jgi:hypothetical protein
VRSRSGGKAPAFDLDIRLNNQSAQGRFYEMKEKKQKTQDILLTPRAFSSDSQIAEMGKFMECGDSQSRNRGPTQQVMNIVPLLDISIGSSHDEYTVHEAQ